MTSRKTLGQNAAPSPLAKGRKALTRHCGAKEGHPRTYTPATFAHKTRLRKVGRRGVKLSIAHRKWRQLLLDMWGERCIWPFGDPCGGHLEAMHAFGKGAHPEWRVEPWNGFVGCGRHHRTARENFTSTPWLTRALQTCADEVRSAHENKRPSPTWEELQDIIILARRNAR
jgi:hypothetical protein